ncbi:MAG: FAD-binding protein [Bacteroidales bacterium]|nr:FAD-binding protein [Bacteroidales bacterium]
MKEFEITYDLKHVPSHEELVTAAARAMGVTPKSVSQVIVLRRSLDARNNIVYRYRIAATVTNEDQIQSYKLSEYKNVTNAEPVIIIGCGPAGMFAALRLLMEGKKPVIIERGKDIHARKYDIALLSREQFVNENSNYCFGEGGAGTFSDGKLFTRSNKRGDIREVLHQFINFGAPENILLDAHPHIGSDILPGIVENIRNCIIEHGGEYHFNSQVVDMILSESGKNREWKVICSSGEYFCAKNVILATGHSARDIYRMFTNKGWALEAKGFALGVRVEHPQSLINKIQYGGKYQPFMPPAEYSLIEQVEGRGVFSFCMCPGGIIVPSSTSQGEVVLNGMSNSMRNSQWANAGIVCSVEPGDIPEYDKSGVLALLDFQQALEKNIFNYSSSLRAPAQRMIDFCRRNISHNLPKSSYMPGTVSAPLNEILPEFVYSRLRVAFPQFNRKMKGYYTDEALLLACESRTSSPVRIPRDPDTMQHITLTGLYPCGEGSGYSGGIVSSAIDGINCAEMISRNY